MRVSIVVGRLTSQGNVKSVEHEFDPKSKALVTSLEKCYEAPALWGYVVQSCAIQSGSQSRMGTCKGGGA